MTPKITHTKAGSDHKLHVGFENGEAKCVDAPVGIKPALECWIELCE